MFILYFGSSNFNSDIIEEVKHAEGWWRKAPSKRGTVISLPWDLMQEQCGWSRLEWMWGMSSLSCGVADGMSWWHLDGTKSSSGLSKFTFRTSDMKVQTWTDCNLSNYITLSCLLFAALVSHARKLHRWGRTSNRGGGRQLPCGRRCVAIAMCWGADGDTSWKEHKEKITVAFDRLLRIHVLFCTIWGFQLTQLSQADVIHSS